MKRNAILIFALLGIGVMFAVGTGTASGYSVSVSGETDVPSWTFEVDGESYTADSVAIVSDGDISFTTTAPSSDSSYNAYLYDRDGNIVQQRSLEGDDSGSFSTSCSSCSPGTYLVAVSDEEIEDAKPVIIEGHSVDISAPSSVDTDSTVTIDITTSGNPSSVELIIGQDDPTRIEAEGSGGEYTATIDGSEFDTGEYTLYGATLNGDELTGLSDSASLTIEEADSSGGSEDSSSGGSSGGGGGGSTTPASNAEFNVTTASINATTIDAGEAVAVTMTVENVGDADGEYEARVRTDGETVASGTVEVPEGASKDVTLVTTFNSAGEFELMVDDYGALATLTVEGTATATPGTQTATATSTETATSTDSPTPTDSGVITPNESTETPSQSDGAAPTIPFVVAVLSVVGIVLRRRGR
ncbi:MAG: hypothetical protein ACI8TL_001500 [Natronomonas sp.]|jgi:hypothetical protein